MVKKRYGETLKDLIAAGLLSAGDTLVAVPRRYTGKSALVNADGQLSLEGKNFETPSAAARYLSDKAENGWEFWRTLPERGDETLRSLRDRLRNSSTDRSQNGITGENGRVLEEDESETSGVISSFGMFWRRNQVDWSVRRKTKILGVHATDSDQTVDFAGQIGVYLLHDGSRTIYVGRVTEKRLGERLYDHTVDRLSGRWDRFSWFGLSPVTSEGKLGTAQDNFPSELVISTMEAVLIEGLEPPQNRRQGDGMKGQEYLQVLAPEIEKKRMTQMMLELLN